MAIIIQFLAGTDFYLLQHTHRATVVFTQPPVQWVPQALFPGVKHPGQNGPHIHLVPSLTHHLPYALIIWYSVQGQQYDGSLTVHAFIIFLVLKNGLSWFPKLKYYLTK